MKRVDIILWVSLLPLCLIIALLSTFPLHWFLWATLNKFVDPYPEYLERLLTPLVMGAIFVWNGYLIAPSKKYISVMVFGIIWSLLFLSVIIFGYLETTILGIKLSFNGSDILIPICGIIGGLTGMYIAWRIDKQPT